MPIYLHYLGPDAFGLIGIYTLMQAWFNLLDLGLSPMLSRVFAQHESNEFNNKQLINLIRSVEFILLLFSSMFILFAYLLNEKLVEMWLTSDEFTNQEISRILMIFYFMIFLRLFEGIYKSVLIGMQKHLLVNLVLAIVASLKTLSSIIVIIFFSSNIEIFFLIQLIFGLIITILLLYLVYKRMPHSMILAKFSIASIKPDYKFSIGLAGVTILSLCLTQLDKVILTTYLSLAEFGYYTLSASVASILHMLITPISIALGPKLAAFQKKNELDKFETSFLFGSEFVGLIVCTIGGIIVVFSYELLSIWTSNSEIASATFMITSILVLGNIFNSMMWMPFQAQVAYGWSSLSLKTNLVSIALIIPLNLILIPKYGAYAAVTIWVILNLGYVLIGSQIMFSKILLNAKRKWFILCVLKPILIGLSIPTIIKFFITLSEVPVIFLFQLLIITLITITIIVMTSDVLRRQLFRFRED